MQPSLQTTIRFTPGLIALLAATTLAFASCASTAESQAMTVTGFAPQQAKTFPTGIIVTQVTGGPEEPTWYTSEITIPEFKEALTQSLKAQDWLQTTQTSPHSLTASIESQETDMVGLDAQSWVTVRYVLTPNSSSTPLYDHTIKTGYLVPHGVAFTGVEKMRLALQGAAKDNITQLLQGLSELD